MSDEQKKVEETPQATEAMQAEMEACDQQLRIFRYIRNALTDEGIIPDHFSPQIMAVMIEYANKHLISKEIQASRDKQYNKPYKKAQQKEGEAKDNTDTETSSDWNDMPATEGQKKALFVITHKKDDGGNWKKNSKYQYLPCKIDEMTKQQASDFIDKYGSKREG